MTFIQLEYIVAIDTYRHFATAAGHCFVTQPTLSMQVQKLEEELGLKLFDRSKQPVIPTEAGRAIIEQARKILGEKNIIAEMVQEKKKGSSPGSSASASSLPWLPTCYPSLYRASP